MFRNKKLCKKINFKFCLIDTIPNSSFVNIKTRIGSKLKAFLNGLESADYYDTPLRDKLSAVYTNIGRNLKLINFTFTILDESAKAKTSSSNYALGIAKNKCRL